MYARSEDGDLWNPGLFGMILVAAVTSFLLFVASRNLAFTARRGFFAGAIASYVSFFVLITVGAALHGQLAETLMWTPVILLFGIPFMAPLVVMSWIGARLVFGPSSDDSSHAEQSEIGARQT